MPKPERQLSRSLAYSGRVLDVAVDTVALSNGDQAVREVVVHRGSVVLVPLLTQESGTRQTVLLVRQYRYAVGKHLLELPAGTLEPGEEFEATAARELAEETGFKPGELARLGAFYPTPGYATEEMHFYLATALSEAPLAADDDEDIELVQLPFHEAVERARRGEFDDLKTVAGLLLAASHLNALP